MRIPGFVSISSRCLGELKPRGTKVTVNSPVIHCVFAHVFSIMNIQLYSIVQLNVFVFHPFCGEGDPNSWSICLSLSKSCYFDLKESGATQFMQTPSNTTTCPMKPSHEILFCPIPCRFPGLNHVKCPWSMAKPQFFELWKGLDVQRITQFRGLNVPVSVAHRHFQGFSHHGWSSPRLDPHVPLISADSFGGNSRPTRTLDLLSDAAAEMTSRLRWVGAVGSCTLGISYDFRVKNGDFMGSNWKVALRTYLGCLMEIQARKMKIWWDLTWFNRQN